MKKRALESLYKINWIFAKKAAPFVFQTFLFCSNVLLNENKVMLICNNEMTHRGQSPSIHQQGITIVEKETLVIRFK